MTLDWATLRELAGISDEFGVLSIYATIDPHYRAEQGAKLPWELRLRHELEAVRERVKQEGPREHWRALAQRLDELAPDLQLLTDPSASGQGRALFAPVSGGPVRTVSVQVPLVDEAVCQRRAYVRPLLAAWSTAGPAGAVSIGAEGVRIVDVRFNHAEVLGVIDYESPIEQRELKGPAGANPAMAQQTAPQVDLYERREDKLLRFLRTVGPRIADYAKDREWGYLALTGEAELVQAVRDGLPPKLPARVVTLDHPVNSVTPPKLAALVAPALTEARQTHQREVAQRARGYALSAGNGTCGLGDTLGALQEGRVSHLLLTADRSWSGRRSPDGSLVPDGEVPPGVDAASLVDEPHLGERMIELAFDSSAEVTVLDEEAAAALADADGIGALLRW